MYNKSIDNESANNESANNESACGLTLGLKIDLPCIPRTLKREQCYCGPIREKVAHEKYFRQAIFIYNKKISCCYSYKLCCLSILIINLFIYY